MAFQPGYKARVLVGDFHISTKLTDASFPFAADMHDVTVFTDNGVKRFIPGLDTSTASLSGFVDPDAHSEAAAWTDALPLTYGPNGFAHGSQLFMVDALKTSFEVGTQVSGVASFDLAAQTDGFTDLGTSLHDLTARTTDGNGSNLDGGASSSNGAAGHLHVVAFSGFSAVDVAIQHSTTGSSGWTDLIAFSSVSGTTSQRATATGTVNRYVRAEWDVTGSGSITFMVGFSRR